MIYWNKFKYYEPKIEGKRKFYDNNIYTFDIETSSYLVLNGKQISVFEYESLSDKEKNIVEKKSTMYVWQFGINDTVYYGRTWEELDNFLYYINENVPETKYLFIHNFSYEFQFMQSVFDFTDVMARKTHKVMTAILDKYNFIVKCSLMMSNSSLANLTKNFNLDIEKKVGDLDYSKVRHSKTPLTDKELGYCEYDCLVLYHYIKKELEVYKTVKNIPTTATGKVRRELKELTLTDYLYKAQVRASINKDPHIYNLLIESFAGGYTHSNRVFTDEIIKNVDSYDETSAYPYVMTTYKFPATKFKRCYVKRREDLIKKFAYLLVVKFKNIKSKYYNSFISMSKCRNIKGAKYDNGRVMYADELEIVLTDVDFNFILDSHTCEYEILESHYSIYKYLPKKLINFILDKYVAKTKLKNIDGYEDVYLRIKAMFNAIYGMCVTNNIRDDVIYNSDTHTWSEEELSNGKILDMLEQEHKKAFLSFSYGVWVTAYARDNLLRRVIDLDEYVIYCDTDSIKLRQGYDKNIFLKYNESVSKKINFVSDLLGIDINRYSPKDKKGVPHMLGVFEHEGKKYNKYTYQEFVTQGAKKYAYKERELDEETNMYKDKIHITVAGVPKKAKVSLKKLSDFKDGFIFKYADTNKNTLFYVDNMQPFNLKDYLGEEYLVTDKSGICMIPTTYTLGKALEYANLLSDDSSKRAIYKEV